MNTRWETLTTQDQSLLNQAIGDGITKHTENTHPRNFKNVFKADPKEVVAFNPDWWRYKGVRMNFAVFMQKYLICYK